MCRQACRPPIPQVAQPRRLPLDADAVVKRQRLGDRVVIGRGCVPISSNLRMSALFVAPQV
jgi:hypothetical protein